MSENHYRSCYYNLNNTYLQL